MKRIHNIIAICAFACATTGFAQEADIAQQEAMPQETSEQETFQQDQQDQQYTQDQTQQQEFIQQARGQPSSFCLAGCWPEGIARMKPSGLQSGTGVPAGTCWRNSFFAPLSFEIPHPCEELGFKKRIKRRKNTKSPHQCAGDWY